MFYKLKSFVAFLKYDNTVCNCRSRFDKFVYFNRPRTHGVRDREPSRIPKKRIIRILKKSRKVSTSEKANRSLPECIFLLVKLVKKFMHMESDVRIKEQWNIPLLQSGENIQSLKNKGY